MIDLGSQKVRRYQQGCVAVWRAIFMSAVVAMSAPGLAEDDPSALPTDCDTARDWAKSKYGSVRHYFDAVNRCVSQADGDLNQCAAEHSAQQGALGDFIFAQRVAQDVCGREGGSADSA